MRLVDLNVDGPGDDDLEWADMAFISAMAVQRRSVTGRITDVNPFLVNLLGSPAFQGAA